MPFENLCHKTYWEQGIFSLSCPPTYLLQSLAIEAMKPKTLHDAYACFVFLESAPLQIQFCFYTPLYHS